MALITLVADHGSAGLRGARHFDLTVRDDRIVSLDAVLTSQLLISKIKERPNLRALEPVRTLAEIEVVIRRRPFRNAAAARAIDRILSVAEVLRVTLTADLGGHRGIGSGNAAVFVEVLFNRQRSVLAVACLVANEQAALLRVRVTAVAGGTGSSTTLTETFGIASGSQCLTGRIICAGRRENI